MCVYIHIYIYIYTYTHTYSYSYTYTYTYTYTYMWPTAVEQRAASQPVLGIHYRGVHWEGGAVDWGSIIQSNNL